MNGNTIPDRLTSVLNELTAASERCSCDATRQDIDLIADQVSHLLDQVVRSQVEFIVGQHQSLTRFLQFHAGHPFEYRPDEGHVVCTRCYNYWYIESL